MQTPFDDLDPRDGFRVFDHALGQMEVSIYVAAWYQGQMAIGALQTLANGETLNHAEVWNCHNPTAKEYGEKNRALLVMESIINYFNAGGSWSELDGMLSEARKVIAGGIVMPGYHVFDCYNDTEGNFTVLYVKEDDPTVEPEMQQAVRWVRGQYIDTELTLNDLVHELEDDSDDEQRSAHSLSKLLHQKGSSASSSASEGSVELPRTDTDGREF